MKAGSALLLLAVLCLATALVPRPALGQAEEFRLNVFSDGSDGDFAPESRIEIDLGAAFSDEGTTWQTPSMEGEDGNGGPGVYDPEKWAVVFKYRSVHVPPGVTVTFKNHPSRAPVVWLVGDDVLIEGVILLDGARITSSRFATEPGPGGFRGGFGFNVGSTIRGGGFGPGGGSTFGVSSETADFGGAASYFTSPENEGSGATYGNEAIVPLLGGSGAGGGRWNRTQGLFPGSPGGGAILIAAGGTITIDGTLRTNGGVTGGANAGGSGGGLRLIAQFVEGNGTVQARGASGAGDGRVRVEAFESTLRQSSPPYTFADTGDPPILWPPETAPRIEVTEVVSAEIGDLAVPTDPRASFAGFANADVFFNTEQSITVRMAAANVPLDWTVTVRIVPKTGDELLVPAASVGGNVEASFWEASFTPASGISAVQAHAQAPLTP